MAGSTRSDFFPKEKSSPANEPPSESELNKTDIKKTDSCSGDETANHCLEEPLVFVGAENKKSARPRKIFLFLCSALAALLVLAISAGVLYFKSIGSSLEYEGDAKALRGSLAEANHRDPFYVLVIGSDNWENYGARSDAIVLIRVDLNNAKVTMVSIPRDTPYSIDGRTVKLNQVFAEGGEVACINAVSELTGVNISHYIEVEFDQFEQVVDSLGGLRVEVPYSFDYQVYTKDEPVIHVDEGEQILTGEQAVALARMRTTYSDPNVSQDAIRQANVRAMMVGMIKQVLEKPVSEIPSQIQTLASMIQTDIALDDLISWAVVFAQAPEVTLYSCTGPSQGGIDESTGLWLTEEAPEQWALLMSTVNSGSDPSMVLRFDESNDGKVELNTKEVVE